MLSPSGALSDKFRHVSDYQSDSLNTDSIAVGSSGGPTDSQAPTYFMRVGVHTG